MPLQLEKAVALAVLVRRCAGLALEGILKAPMNPLFNLDECNRFLACRDGMNAELINPFSATRMTMHYWFKSLLRELGHAEIPQAEKPYIHLLESQLPTHDNSQWMRKLWQETGGDRRQDFQSYCEALSQALLQETPALRATVH
jgi:gamma-glutamyl:cysteine ligase YbdK (ATP-grasp superfamily)